MIRKNPFANVKETTVQEEEPRPTPKGIVRPPKANTEPNNLQDQKTFPTSQPTPQQRFCQTPTVQQPVQNTVNDDLVLEEYQRIKNSNCSKGFLRTTTERIPASQTLLKESSLPIGLIIHPGAPLEGEIPTVSYGENEIPRCASQQCRGYINPFVKWIEGGEKWICNLCKYVNNTEEYYYAKLDKYGNRVDADERLDMSLGSYEFIANKTYMKKDRPPVSPNYIFVIDVSLATVHNNFLSAVVESIKDTINSDAFNYSERTKVSNCLY